MTIKIGVIDYGVAGNLHSILKAVKQVTNNVVVIKNAADLNEVDKLILPGVGSFADAMRELAEQGLDKAIIAAVQDRKIPVLGICLGMQILAKLGYEQGETIGLGLLDAEVRAIKCKGVLPHMGFNKIMIQKNSRLFSDIENGCAFYFMHSYEVCNYMNVLALSSYHDHTFVCAIEKDNIFGVQFHPEKSREAGLKIFHNFVHNI